MVETAEVGHTDGEATTSDMPSVQRRRACTDAADAVAQLQSLNFVNADTQVPHQ
jgi:hypothetical protein